MREIKIRMAVDDQGKLTRIDDATRENKYFCPACKMPLIVRKGDIKIHHFAHKSCNFCSQETVIHKTAKLLLQKLVSDWKNEIAPPPKVNRKCQICHATIQQPLPDKVQSAVLEVTLSDGSIIDVALMGSEKVLAGIEVKVTHEVNSEKAESLPIPFIEIDGYSFVENPNEINVLQDKFNPITCESCKDKFRRFKLNAIEVSKQTNIDLPTEYYRFGISNCWKCNKTILVFTWPDHTLFSTKGSDKKPRPATIQWKYSKMAGSSYWANCCPYCNSIQGDFFLHAEPEGPFFGLNEVKDDKVSFDKDMKRIAYLWDYNHFG